MEDSVTSAPQPRWIPITRLLVNGINEHPFCGNGVPGGLSGPDRCGSNTSGQNSRCRVATTFPTEFRTVSTAKLRRPRKPAARLDGSGTSLTDPPGPRITRVSRIGAVRLDRRTLNRSGAPRATAKMPGSIKVPPRVWLTVMFSCATVRVTGGRPAAGRAERPAPASRPSCAQGWRGHPQADRHRHGRDAQGPSRSSHCISLTRPARGCSGAPHQVDAALPSAVAVQRNLPPKMRPRPRAERR